MPSFDITSKVNTMELENAINQARKEIATRFDLKDTKSEIILEKSEITLKAENAFNVKTLAEITKAKLSKRGIHPKSVDVKEPEISPLGHARQIVNLKQGIEPAVGKEISLFVRSLGLKVTCQIQGDALRVAGKSRDDLQSVISAVKAKDFPCAVGFENFRD